MKKIFFFMLFLLIIPPFLFAAESKENFGENWQGYVPDETTAIRIAEAVLMPIYGKAQIESERPFKAELKDESWSVKGTLHCPNGEETCKGGVAEAYISQYDGRILGTSHGE